jgi:hypothetical protein
MAAPLGPNPGERATTPATTVRKRVEGEVEALARAPGERTESGEKVWTMAVSDNFYSRATKE